MRRTILLLAAVCCSCAGFDEGVEPLPEAAAPSERIGSLRDMYLGTPVTVRENIVISGRITTSDEEGNFYRTFVVEDESGAVEVMAGLYEMHRSWPPGMRVSVRLQGLAMECRAGIMRVGLPAGAWSGYGTDYMNHPAMVARYVDRSDDIRPVVPRRAALRDLNEAMCGRLVEIDGLLAADTTAATWADIGPEGSGAAGYRKFFDAAGDSVVVVTSPYAVFAAHAIVRYRVRLRGILMYDAPGVGRKCYMLKLRSEKDAEYEDR